MTKDFIHGTMIVATMVAIVAVGVFINPSEPQETSSPFVHHEELETVPKPRVPGERRGAQDTGTLAGAERLVTPTEGGVRAQGNTVSGGLADAASQQSVSGSQDASPVSRQAPEVQGGENIADMRIEDDAIRWESVRNDVASVSLKVVGPGIAPFERGFSGGEGIEFPVRSDDGNVWADGVYSWELTASPRVSDEHREMMREVRELTTADNAEEILRYNGVFVAQLPKQSGTFRILDGELVTGAEEVEESVAQASGTAAVTGESLLASASVADADEGVQLRDQVILDDLIVDGSAVLVWIA